MWKFCWRWLFLCEIKQFFLLKIKGCSSHHPIFCNEPKIYEIGKSCVITSWYEKLFFIETLSVVFKQALTTRLQAVNSVSSVKFIRLGFLRTLRLLMQIVSNWFHKFVNHVLTFRFRNIFFNFKEFFCLASNIFSRFRRL